MAEINERFKDVKPEVTVENLQRILKQVGIELKETWTESGIDNCYSVHVEIEGVYPFFTNGKGVTKALARASAYGEFIEQLQCGLFLYKFQSINRDAKMDLQNFAPDGKYMTAQELEETGDWMDYLIETYGSGLTRQKLVQLCKDFSCSEGDEIWTLPFYSLFEDKYVYLPAGFMLQLYAANGGCAGNTREEAWIHGLSEIMERRCTIDVVTSGQAAPKIPDEMIREFEAPAQILDAVRDSGLYDIQLFDFSNGNGYPVIAACIVNKQTHEYLINVAADPVFEIAVDRTLTECFQGRSIKRFLIGNKGIFQEEAPHIPRAHNLLNQIEHANGLYSVNFFADDDSCQRECTRFADRSQMSNKELIKYMLGLLKDTGKPVYVRNFSFLDFHSYQFIIPGYSETRTHHLYGTSGEYAMGDAVQKAFRNVATATPAQLMLMQAFHTRISTAFSRRQNFRGLAGLPLDSQYNQQLLSITLSYAAYQMNRYQQSADYLNMLLSGSQADQECKAYYACVKRYLTLKKQGMPEDRIRQIIGKFFEAEYVEKLYRQLEQGGTPFDEDLIRCECKDCEQCRHRSVCAYPEVAAIQSRLGERYKEFVDGQKRENLAIDTI